MTKPIINPPNIGQDLKRNVQYYRRLRPALEGLETKAKLTHLRNEWLKKQNRLNYSLEYERILGILNGSVVRGGDTEQLHRRRETLEGLMRDAV
mgnify:CR=1 FL=1